MGNPKVPPVPSKALKYLTETRGLTLEEIEKYHLGCFDGRDEKGRFTPHFKTYLKTKYPDAEPCDFVFMGLLRPREKREYEIDELKALRWEDLLDPYDQVSGPYVTFPSYSQKKSDGKEFVSSYVKRNINPNKKAERYSSHDWGGAPKIVDDNMSLLPFGGVWPEFHQETTDAIVLTEGNIDAIIANRIPGVTAISNKTANIGDKKIQALIDYGKPIIIAFDNDEKGRNGANKLSERLSFSNVPHATLEYESSDGKDLDEINRQSPNRLQKIFEKAFQSISTKTQKIEDIQSQESYQKVFDFYKNQKEIILCLDSQQASEIRNKGFRNIMTISKIKEVFRKGRSGHNAPNTQRYQLADPEQISMIQNLPADTEFKILTPNTPNQRVIGAQIATFLNNGLQKKASIIPFKGNYQTENLEKEEIQSLIKQSGDFDIADWNKRRGEEGFMRNTRRISLSEDRKKPGSISTYQKRYLKEFLAMKNTENLSFEQASSCIASAPSGLLTDDRAEQKLTQKEWNSAVGYAYVMERKDDILSKFVSPEQTAKYIVELAKSYPQWKDSGLDYIVDRSGIVHLNDYIFKEKQLDSNPEHATSITYNPEAANGKGSCIYSIWSGANMSDYLVTNTLYSDEEAKSPDTIGMDMLAVTRAITNKSIYESFNIMKDYINSTDKKLHVHLNEHEESKETKTHKSPEKTAADKIITESKIKASQMPTIKHRK